MTYFIERTRNTNSAPVHSSVLLNNSTWTEILDSNENRISMEIFNNNSQDVLLYFSDTASAVDADAIPLNKGDMYHSLPDNIDTSKVSAKAVSGAPTLIIKES